MKINGTQLVAYTNDVNVLAEDINIVKENKDSVLEARKRLV
jgi:hypothetical protein